VQRRPSANTAAPRSPSPLNLPTRSAARGEGVSAGLTMGIAPRGASRVTESRGESQRLRDNGAPCAVWGCKGGKVGGKKVSGKDCVWTDLILAEPA
jgi:hypothetical protein